MTETVLQPKSASPKREEIKAAVRDRARKIGPGGKLPTVIELCQSLGVAKATLNSALDGLQAEGVVWRKRGSGIYVSPRIHQKTIGLVLGKNIFRFGQSPFYAMLIERCQQRAANHGEAFSFYLDVPGLDSGEALPVHSDLAEACEQRKLDGVLLASRSSKEQAAWLRSRVPAVVSLVADKDEPCSVAVDYGSLVRLGVDALVAQGCRRIGMITPFGWTRPGFEDDRQAYRETLASRGLAWQPDWIWELHTTDNREDDMVHGTREEQGYRALQQLLGADRHALDGLMIADDMMARGALVAARKLGLVPGRDLKIATHATKGAPVLQGHETELTLVEVDIDEIVTAAFEMLEQLMAGAAGAAQPRLIQPKLSGNGGEPVRLVASVGNKNNQ